MANERVLVVDDSIESVNFIVEYVLLPNGYQPLVARDGQEGLEMALEQRPDLILLDLNMPKLTGIEVIESLNEQAVKIPVIVMTFHGSETLAVKAFRLGIKDYLLKPFELLEILDSIERALTEARLRKERDELTQRLLKTNQQLEQRLKEINTLFGIGKSVTSVLDQDKLLSRLVEAAVYLTNAEEGSLMLLDSNSNELYMAAARGVDERLARSFHLQVEDSLAGRVVQSGQPLMLSGQDITKISTSYLVRSLIYMPMKAKGRIRGVLSVNNRHNDRDFTNHDLRLLSTLADYAAISLENAQLFQQVESEHNKLVTLLNEIEEPIAVISDETNAVAMTNAAFQEAFHLSSPVPENAPLSALVQSPTLQDFIKSTPADSTHKREIILDQDRIFQVMLTPIPNVGQAIIMQNVTAFKEMDRMKSDFVSKVSHDLRSPLVSLKDYATMIKSAGTLNDKQELFTDRIVSGAEKLVGLVDSLLDLSKIETKVDPDTTVVDVHHLMTNLVAEFQDQANRKQQQLIYHGSSQPAPVEGNELRLLQLFYNLMDNAIKYTPAGGQIAAIVQVNGGQVLVKVEDNGPGIPRANLPFVFDKFYRAVDDESPELQG
ncbi:MAG: response regulator, partial [Chloroflexota bacterium]